MCLLHVSMPSVWLAFNFVVSFVSSFTIWCNKIYQSFSFMLFMLLCLRNSFLPLESRNFSVCALQSLIFHSAEYNFCVEIEFWDWNSLHMDNQISWHFFLNSPLWYVEISICVWVCFWAVILFHWSIYHYSIISFEFS